MAETRYINPYTDFGFKKLFGTELNKEKKKVVPKKKLPSPAPSKPLALT